MGKKKGWIKKVLEFLWKHIQPIILMAGSFFLLIFAAKDYFDKRGITKINWKMIPGTKTRVKVRNRDKEWEEIKLPVVDGVQITTDDITTIRKTEKEGEYAAKTKHKIKDRRNIIITDTDNTSMDI